MLEIKSEIRELLAALERGDVSTYKIVDKLNQLLRMLDALEEGE